MIEITGITAGSPAAKAGIRAGDCLIAVNDTVIHDVLDYRFAITEKHLNVRFFREGEELTVVPLIYIAGDTGASLSYYSTWHGKQTISLKKVSE